MSRKSYNPFRMGGSYAGAGTGLLLSLIKLKSISPEAWLNPFSEVVYHALDNNLLLKIPLLNNVCSLKYDIINGSLYGYSNAQIPYIQCNVGIILIGFLIGWGIHSLIRRFYK